MTEMVEDRPVGYESRKSFAEKCRSGFWARYVTGPAVLDIGFRGFLGEDQPEALPIMPGAIGIDLDYPGYDGMTLPFADESQDAVYSSHCLEHVPHYIQAIQDWYRVLKFGGHMITVVPHAFLYERARRPPSRWNPDHKRFYTPASLLAEFEQALPPNAYRVRHLADNDAGYDYGVPLDEHPTGCLEIELVIQKLRAPGFGAF
jgi:SAM-dependent methyltransferase